MKKTGNKSAKLSSNGVEIGRQNEWRRGGSVEVYGKSLLFIG
jgi:hypothetical protein